MCLGFCVFLCFVFVWLCFCVFLLVFARLCFLCLCFLCGCVFVFFRVCIFVCLCFCDCVCVFARLCFSVFACVFVFVVKTPPFAREAAEGGNGGSNPPGPHFTCI